MIQTLLFLVTCLFRTLHTFNIDTKSPYIIKTDSENYFGFTVALHKNDAGSFLMVGAPIASTGQANITEGGAVYKCLVPDDIGDPTEPAICTQQLTVLDDTGNKYVNKYDTDGDDYSYNKTDWYNIQKEEKSNQWLGVSLQSTIDSDYLVGCAHRYETRYLTIDKYLSDPPRQLTGKCTLLDKDFQDLEKTFRPCYDVESGYSKYGLCQAGASAFILDNMFVLGAPGCFEGSGCVWMYDLDSWTMDGATNEQFTDPDYEGSLPYTGYSSVICDMNGDGTSDLITGGPRGKLYKGEVFIYESLSSSTLELVQSQMLPFDLTGEQMGSYYGASLLCQDMNGDGFDDLLVGAPWYTVYDGPGQGQPDTGRVYFYPGAQGELGLFLPYEDEYDLTKLQSLTGSSSDEAFGFSMSSAGDVNEDGLYDMFIGSPYYNDGEGRISLFLGGLDGILTTPSQVISPTDLGVLDGLRGFGWSIAGGKDVDGNSFHDVLVGAYKSHHAVLLRTMPIIDVAAQIVVVGAQTELDPHGEPNLETPDGEMVVGLTFQACFEYTGVDPDETTFVEVGFQITLDSDVMGPPRLATNISDPRSQIYESTLSVELQNGIETCTAGIQAYYSDTMGPVVRMHPIQFSMAASLGETETFATRAVLNQHLISDSAILLPIASDCPKDTEICENEMKIEALGLEYTDQDKYPVIVLGLVTQVTAPIKVTNLGPHTAYGPALTILNVPVLIGFLGPKGNGPLNCETVEEEGAVTYEIRCRLPDQMKPNMSVSIDFKFDLSELTEPVTAELSAQVTVSEPSQVINSDVSFTFISLEVENLAQLEIRSGSSQERLPFNNKYGKANKVLGYKGPTVRHMFELSLAEDSIRRYVNDIVVAIYWPLTFPDGAWLFPLSNVVEAMLPDGNTTSTTVSCNYTIIDNWDLLWDSLNQPDEKWSRVSCRDDPGQCQRFTCAINLLERGGARVKLSFYTNVEEYFLYNFGELTVESFAEIESVGDDMMLPKHRNTTARTVLYPSKSKSKNFLWIVIGSVVGGLLLLFLIVVLLWKIGFFKRMKPEQQPATTVGYRTQAFDDDDNVYLAPKYNH